ncbi:MAG TPA: M48 family metallopeptidase [Deltaproteobacteria bacterium]|nr:M48 family metallopeptidase [Deltaproteobacteria bacterium]
MFWKVIASNRRRTVLLVLVMGMILAVLGFLLGEAVGVWTQYASLSAMPGGDGAAAGHRAGFTGLCVAGVFWIVLLLVSLLGSDQLFLSLAGAREVTHGMYPQLHNVVEEMQIASSLPVMPRIYIVEDPAPNAFAVGKSTRNSAVCVTAGLLAMCDRDELQGVIAHEIGHITNRDVLYLTVAATMLGAVTIIADTLLRSLRYAPAARYRSSGPRAGKGTVNLWILLAAAVFVVVSPVLSRILYFSISRRREFLADATSARLTRFPDGLASALEKMMLSPERLTTAPKAAAPFYIANPYKQDLHGGMFATHPPLRTRIGILRAMHTGAAFKDYMKAFWEVTRTRKPLIPTSDMQLGRTVEKRGPRPDENHAAAAPGSSARKAGDIMRAMNDYLFITCACGMKMKVPPEFARGKVRCPRCSREHKVGDPDQEVLAAILTATAPLSGGGQPSAEARAAARVPGDAQVEPRKPGTWQTLTCRGCGRGVQVSPVFHLSRVTCSGCGNVITLEEEADGSPVPPGRENPH